MPRQCACALLVAVLIGCLRLAPTSARADSDVLRQAREAIGGEARLQAVRTLSVKGGFQTQHERQRFELVEFQMAFALPDRFLVSNNWPGAFLQRVGGFNGDRLIEQRLWRDKWTDLDVGDGGKEDLGREMAARRRESLRYLVAWLLGAPPECRVEFTDAGEERTDQGPADVVLAKGAYDFAARLLFHKQTHRLLFVAYHEPPLPPPAPPGANETPQPGEPLFTTLEGPASKAEESRMHLSSFHDDDGIRFPHSMRVESEGLVQEWSISRIRVNPAFDAGLFEPRKTGSSSK